MEGGAGTYSALIALDPPPVADSGVLQNAGLDCRDRVVVHGLQPRAELDHRCRGCVIQQPRLRARQDVAGENDLGP